MEGGLYNGFMQQHFFSLFSTVFQVLTDSTHKAGFKDQVKILFLLMREVSGPKVRDATEP